MAAELREFLAGLATTRCQVLDIAAGRARIRTEARIPLGPTVELIIGDWGVFPGKILWHRGSHAGIGFSTERATAASSSIGAILPRPLGSSGAI